MISVLYGYLAGFVVECQYRGTGYPHKKLWLVCNYPVWNFEDYDYRVTGERNLMPIPLDAGSGKHALRAISALEIFNKDDELQYRNHGSDTWTYTDSPIWDFQQFEFREVQPVEAPEPEPQIGVAVRELDARQMIAVLNAYLEGFQISYQLKEGIVTYTTVSPSWNFEANDYYFGLSASCHPPEQASVGYCRTLQIISVLLDWQNGADIEFKHRLSWEDDWARCNPPEWNWLNYDYRAVEKAVTEPEERPEPEDDLDWPEEAEEEEQPEPNYEFAENIVEVMQQFLDGELIEYRPLFDQALPFMPCPDPLWNWERVEYRIKCGDPEPEKDPLSAEIYVAISEDGRTYATADRNQFGCNVFGAETKWRTLHLNEATAI